MRPYPPLGILCVSAWLEEQGITNEVFDSTFSTREALEQYLLIHRPPYVAFYVNLMTRVNILQLITFIRAKKELQHTTIILGGPEVRYNADDLLQHGANYLVIGEGEQTITALITTLDAGEQERLSEVQGIGYLNAQGEPVYTAERTKLRSINELPFPNRKKIDLQQYLTTWKQRHGLNAISVSTMRGCPYTCKWCSRAVYGLSYRRRSPEKVVDELEYIQQTYNPDTLWFVDDVFTVSHKWLQAFNEELKRRNVTIAYECITRADRMNEEVIRMMKESGCFRVWIGAESGSQKIIDLMDRRVSVEEVRTMIQMAQQHGIQAGTFIMLGYPGETEQDIYETIHHLKVSNPDYFTITVAYPIKGTELFEEVEAIQTNAFNWQMQNDRDRDFQRTYHRRYYDYAVRRVVNEVNFNKKKLNNQTLTPSAVNLKLRSFVAKMGMWWYRQKSSA